MEKGKAKGKLQGEVGWKHAECSSDLSVLMCNTKAHHACSASIPETDFISAKQFHGRQNQEQNMEKIMSTC